VSVLRHGRHIPSAVEEEGPQVYRVNFIPDGAGQYKIHVLFNRMEVKGSPFILDIADASAVSVFGEQLRGASVGRPASFMIHAAAAAPNDITVEITGMLSCHPTPLFSILLFLISFSDHSVALNTTWA
ncbi:hypothetical protein GCK32_021193, partial [Trichostrongylus colubriformis]